MSKSRCWVLPVVVAATATHAVLGLIGLGEHSLWLDEEMSLGFATATWEAMAGFYRGLPEQHPLYYLILRVWTSAFGTSEVALRSLSLVFGVAAIPLIFVLGRRLAGEVVGSATATFLALSPFWLYYSQEGRMYTLLVTLVILSSIVALTEVRGAGRETEGLPWAYWCLAILGMYTHFFFAFVLLAHMAATVLRSKDWRRNTIRALLLSFPVLVAYVPWLTLLLANMPEGQGWKGPRHLVYGVSYTLVRFAIGYGEFLANYRWQERLVDLLRENALLLGSAVFAHAILFMRGAVALGGRPRVDRTFVWTGLVLPVALPLMLAPIMILSGERYFMVVLPFYLLVVASGAVTLLRPGSRRILRASVPVLFLLVTARTVYAHHTNPDFGKEQWKEVVARIDTASDPDGTLVLVAPENSVHLLLYYLDDSETIRVQGWRPDEVTVEDDVLIWVVVARLLDPDEITATLPAGWKEVSRRLYPKETGIWLIAFRQVGS